MEPPPPLTLNILRLTPSTLLSPISSPLTHDVPPTAAPRPSLPSSFSFSPTHNYPAPFGSMTLGSSLAVAVQLVANPLTSPRVGTGGFAEEEGDLANKSVGLASQVGMGRGGVQGVEGVKMMLEVQGPGGRWRLGEVIHGQQEEEDPNVDVVDDGKREKEVLQGEEQDVGGTKGEVPDPDEKAVEAELSSEDVGETSENSPSPDEAGTGTEIAQQRKDQKTPLLPPGEFVELDVAAEMKELGLQVLICSVAWETAAGRRTFQRFFKFNVVAPLAIKTKIHPSLTPATLLDPQRRSDVYLEVLMQNTSSEAILFDRVNLEPVFGMTSRSIGATRLPSGNNNDPTNLVNGTEEDPPGQSNLPEQLGSLHPGDTRQYLFLLHPDPPKPTKHRQSVFSPSFPPGTILPLGRLDMEWVAGPYRERGRLQTSTLNRRVAVVPVVPKISVEAPALQPQPTRTTTAAPSTPGQSVTGTPARRALRVDGEGREEEEVEDQWEYDLAVMEIERDAAEVDKEFSIQLRIGVRRKETLPQSSEDGDSLVHLPPPPLRLGLQYLTPTPLPHNMSSETSVGMTASSLAGPSRSTTPTPIPPRHDLGRAGPPATPPPKAGPSRPMTPISSQLRSATQSHLNLQAITNGSSSVNSTGIEPLPGSTSPATAVKAVFPPPPISIPSGPPAPPPKLASSTSGSQHPPLTGELFPLGPSLQLLPLQTFQPAQEQYSTTYADSTEPPERWEAVYESTLRFLPTEEGLVSLGGVRVLIMPHENDAGVEGRGGVGRIGQEWQTLGDVWISA